VWRVIQFTSEVRFMASETPTPTPAELAILRVLWQRGPSTVREIHEALKDERETGLSTTLKFVQLMTEKGLVLKEDSGRPQVFKPAQARESTQMRLLDELIQRAFDGSASNLVMRAVAVKRISAKELAEIKKLIDGSRKERKP
jgi:BlaI family penicillinase repressor